MNKHELIGLARLEEAFREHDKLYLEKYPPLENEEIDFSEKQIRSKKKRFCGKGFCGGFCSQYL